MSTERGLQLRCEELVELVTDYLEGAITDPDRLELIDAHLELHDPCTLYVEQIRQTITALSQLPKARAVAQAELLPKHIWERLFAAFRAKNAR
jgi:hypothetical protein